MTKNRFTDKKILMIIALTVGVSGGILFFPFNFQDEYTCLYHRLYSLGHSYDSNGSEKNFEGLAEPERHKHHLPGSNAIEMEEDLVNHYVVPFGLMWWSSLLLVAASLYGLKRIKIQGQH